MEDYLKHKYSGTPMGVEMSRIDELMHLPSMILAEAHVMLKSFRNPMNVAMMVGPGGIAKRIAGGHAMKHAAGLGVRTEAELAAHVERVMSNPTATRNLSRGRTAYWDDSTQSVVIHDPNHVDGGTVFKPKRGKAYFDGLD
jgi:hypothetical protein